MSQLLYACNRCPMTFATDDVGELASFGKMHQHARHSEYEARECTATEGGGFQCERTDPHGERGHWISWLTQKTRLPRKSVDFRTLERCPDHDMPDCSALLNGCSVMAMARAARREDRSWNEVGPA